MKRALLVLVSVVALGGGVITYDFRNQPVAEASGGAGSGGAPATLGSPAIGGSLGLSGTLGVSGAVTFSSTVNGTTIPASKTLVVTTDTLAVHAATTSAQLFGVISDETGGTGVAVGSVSPALTGTATAVGLTVSGALLANGQFRYPAGAAASTAHAGGGQASALTLTEGFINQITTVASAGDSVKCPAASGGGIVGVFNDGANALDLFPPTSGKFNNGTLNAALSVPAGYSIWCILAASPDWECFGTWVHTSAQTAGLTSDETGTGLLVFNTSPSIAGVPLFTDSEVTLTAHAGGGQASALALSSTKFSHEVTTVGTAADSVALPVPAAGTSHIVSNSAATNAMQLFGVSPTKINGIATATGMSLPAGRSTLCVAVSTTNYACTGPN